MVHLKLCLFLLSLIYRPNLFSKRGSPNETDRQGSLLSRDQKVALRGSTDKRVFLSHKGVSVISRVISRYWQVYKMKRF